MTSTEVIDAGMSIRNWSKIQINGNTFYLPFSNPFGVLHRAKQRYSVNLCKMCKQTTYQDGCYGWTGFCKIWVDDSVSERLPILLWPPDCFWYNKCVLDLLTTIRPRIYPDSKVHGANMGPPVSCRPQMSPCWPHEPCYQGMYIHQSPFKGIHEWKKGIHCKVKKKSTRIISH